MSARTAPGAKSSRTRSRLWRTASGSSSPTSARLRLSKGTALTPSYLSVNARSTGPVLLRWEYIRGSVDLLLQEVRDVELVVVVRRLAPGRRRTRSRRLRTGPDDRTLGTDGDRLPTRSDSRLGSPALLG